MTSTQPLTVGVVGAGGIAHPHLAAWRYLGVPVVVHSDEGAAAAARQYGARSVAHLDELLGQCDVVDVCTPTFTHHDIVLSAAAAGRHVICEKPLSHTRHEAVEMIEACAAAGVQLHPGHVVRYFPEYVAAKTAVDAGRIGAPAVLRLTRRGARPERSWFAESAKSGGILIDQMIHDFDFARWIAGDVTQVYASVVGSAPGPTIGIAVLTHSSGALTHLVGGWGHPEEKFRTSFSIAGAHGLLRHSSTEAESLSWSIPGASPARGELIPLGPRGRSPFVAELGEFLASCSGGPTPRITAADSLAALAIASAASRSAETGLPVRLEEGVL
ncbi:Gfo/Idh/MocA family oxidoreductase [Demequina sp.]|uniref:Gfo/Idh/MocA family protein n=1 Tax=Demequina sp. TaxID=2050685 RepID=UPI0025C48F58|nr:Gfo/Idh/MocA family oxidoreductase [Demequina sp.]